MYMNKIAVGTKAISKIDINDTVAENINNVAKAKNKAVEDILAVVLSRPRHEELIAEIRATGARIKLIQDGEDRKSTRLNSSHVAISYAVFCLKKKTQEKH